ncbi:hypothetical protein FRC07_007771 [Ceratobasidium sp. 392]|nr:hypothetical protein FRC07_007771 [Ceratobasidium sp. 392]
MDIPGLFASSPVNLGKAPAEPEPEPELDSNEIDARIAVTHISIAPEECTDIESCPSDGSIAPKDFWSEVDPPAASTSRKPYPAERTTKPLEYPTPGATTWRAYGQSTTPFKTPSRHAKVVVKTPSIKLGGPMYFPHNTTIHNVPEAPSESPVNSAEQKSDETLKQGAKKPKLKAQQRAEDMEFLREIIQNNKRLRRMQKVFPDLVPNNKPLLDEVMEALGESSGAEGHESSVWEDEVYRVPMDSPPVQAWEIMSSEPKTQSPAPGPSYFDKGKWVSNEDYEANQDYITAHKPAPTALSEGHKKKKKSKKPRPSLGINLEQICPTQAPNLEKSRDVADLMASITALPFRQLKRVHSSKDNSRKKSRKKKSSKHKSRSEYREENCELKEKVKKAQRASVKLKEPTTYYGQESYDEFELWSYETDQWIKASGFSDTDTVEYMGTFLKKKAGRWYIDHIIPNLDEYTVDSLKMGLFAYCFPSDLKSQLRDEFDTAKQDNQKFVDYLQTLKRLQHRIPDITDRHICLKLWKTVHGYIKIKWIENGLDGETTDLQTLSETAERYEAAERVRWKNEGFRSPLKPKYTIPVQSEPKSEGRKLFLSAPKKPDNANSKPQAETSKGHPKNGKNKDQKPKLRSDKPKMSREERNELRAAGKCFVCKEPGHTVKDCPTRNTAKPASVYSAAMQLKHDLIDELRKQREQLCIDIASIQLANNTRGTNESEEDSSYEITPANTLLNEIMAAVTPYSQIVVADDN